MNFVGESLGLLPRVEKALSALRGVRVHWYVGFGCSDGSITEAVARLVGAEEVYGVDINGTALAKAVQRSIRVLNLDLSRNKVPLDDVSVGLVTAFEVIEHLLNPDNMLREAYRILRPGGLPTNHHTKPRQLGQQGPTAPRLPTLQC